MNKTLAALALSLMLAAPAFAHCDSVNGPVNSTAKQALEKGDVTPVLKWVPAAGEKEIRTAFAKTVAARKASPQAREVADQWFFETLVRVHRESEGAPYTGIKGADYKTEEGIELADQAIDKGSLAEVQKQLVGTVQTGLQHRFAEVLEAKAHANDSVDAGRAYVHAYVEFIHYVERLHQNATTAAGHHAAAHSEH
jgi:hypothetical protein